MKNFVAGVVLWGVATATNLTRDITVAYTGVTLNVLVACAIGTFCSFSWGEPVTPRRKMWQIGFACLFMGAAFTSITNEAIKHFTTMQMTDGLQAGVGAVVSCLTRFLMTWLTEAVRTGSWLNYVPFIRKNNGE